MIVVGFPDVSRRRGNKSLIAPMTPAATGDIDA